jgi:hypothetical protein
LRGALVSDISPESIEDPEVPVEDAIEQHEPLPAEDEDHDRDVEDPELPDEANPADVAEQRQELQPDEDEDTYR